METRSKLTILTLKRLVRENHELLHAGATAALAATFIISPGMSRILERVVSSPNKVAELDRAVVEELSLAATDRNPALATDLQTVKPIPLGGICNPKYGPGKTKVVNSTKRSPDGTWEQVESWPQWEEQWPQYEWCQQTEPNK